MKKFGALNKISRRDFLRLTGSVAGAVAFSERCFLIPEALAAPAEQMENQPASQPMYATVEGDTPDESIVDLGPVLDLFWAVVEPYQMSLDLEHFRYLDGLCYTWVAWLQMSRQP